MGWLTGQIAPFSPAYSTAGSLQYLIDLLVSAYGGWQNVPPDLLAMLLGGAEDGSASGAAGQGGTFDQLLQQFYGVIHETDPATEGAPDFHAGLLWDDDLVEDFWYKVIRPAAHGVQDLLVNARVSQSDAGSGAGSGGPADGLRPHIDGLPFPVWLDQQGYWRKLAQLQTIQKQLKAWKDEGMLEDHPIYRSHLTGIEQIEAELKAIQDRYGHVSVNREPYKDWGRDAVFAEALKRAIASGKLPGAISNELAQLANPKTLAVIGTAIGAYMALHGTPAAPLLLVGDVYFAADGGIEAALAMQRVWNSIKFATTDQEINEASNILIEELSGPAADALLGMLTWGAGRVVGKASDYIEIKVDPTKLGMNGGSISVRWKEPKTIKNGHLAGKTHPDTRVPFDKDGYPIFDHVGEVSLPDELIGPHVSDRRQMRAATRNLWEEIKDSPEKMALFTPTQLDQIRRGQPRIDGLTWHHHQDGVTMQLVDRDIHDRTGHSGGRQTTGGR